jgi:tetratricopeptide (TPR) repeat protein
VDGVARAAPSSLNTLPIDSQPSVPVTRSEMPSRFPTVEGYEITRRIGQGGMGMVFEAIQHATGKRVAIKFLLEESGANDAARERFEREVSIIARFEHPGIVRVIDSGVRKGQYYYVMDYVDGAPLDDSLAQLRSNQRRALRLVIDVCEAVDYAHQRGVLHRDLKPSNILVDKDGRAHLLDFGIAKAEDASGADRGLTLVGPDQIMGTLAYMSPEQAAGEAARASVRTDVYSLGVIVYESLTGMLPIDVDGPLRDVLTRIAEQEPRAPSVHEASIAKDLDAVVLRALEKAPEKRYASARELADDLRRYLASEPVTARRVGPLGRASRWMKRNKALAASMAVGVGTLAVVSGGLVRQVIVERDDARILAKQNEQNAKLATMMMEQARAKEGLATASELESRENFAILRGILESANPEGKGEMTVRQLLEKATANLDGSPPKSPRNEAAVRETLGVAFRNLGVYDEAKSNQRRAYEIRSQYPEEIEALADSAHKLAATLWWRGEYADAEPLYAQSLEIRRRLHAGDHKDVASSLTHRAANNLRLGKVEEAFAGYQEALDMRRRLYAGDHEEIAQSLNNLAKAYLEAERFDQARPRFAEALAMILRVRGEQHGGTASLLSNYAQCLLEEGEVGAAQETYARSLEIRTRLFPSGHPLLAASMVGLARAQLAGGNLAKADETVTGAIALYRRLKHENKIDFGDAMAVQGAVRLAQGQHQGASDILVGATALLSAARPTPEILLAQAEADLGEAMVRLGQVEDGQRQFERGLERVVKQRGAESALAKQFRERLERLTAGVPAGAG